MYYVDEAGFPISISFDPIVSSKAAADEENDHTLLKTTVFSDPEFDGDISFGRNAFDTAEAETKIKKSILQDATNRIRNHKGEHRKNRNYKDKERKLEKDKVSDQVDNKVLERPQDCVPVKDEATQSLRVATNEEAEPEMTYEDSAELETTIFDSSLVVPGSEIKEDMEMENACRRLLFTQTTRTVTWSKDEVESEAGVSTLNCSYSYATTEGEESTFMTTESNLSEGMTTDWKKQDTDPLLSCGLEDNMVENNCFTKEVGEIFEGLISVMNEVADVFSISKWQNNVVKLPKVSEQDILIV